MPDDPAYADGAAFMDGAYMPVSECKIPVLDWGFLRGDATYDVVHTWKGRFFRLDEHLDRFTRNLGRLHYDIPYDRDGIADVLHRCVELTGLEDAFVEMLVTRGIPQNRDPRTSVNRFAVFAVPFVWILRPERHDGGLNVIVSSIERIRAQAVDPTVKNYHWLDLVRGLFEAYEQGGETAVLIDARGNVLEGPGLQPVRRPRRHRLHAGGRRAGGRHPRYRDRAAAAPRRAGRAARRPRRRAARRRRGLRHLHGRRRNADRDRRRPRARPRAGLAPAARRLLGGPRRPGVGDAGAAIGRRADAVVSERVVIAGYVRSPFAPAHRGELARTRPDELGGQVVRALVERSGIDPARSRT